MQNITLSLPLWRILVTLEREVFDVRHVWHKSPVIVPLLTKKDKSISVLQTLKTKNLKWEVESLEKWLMVCLGFHVRQEQKPTNQVWFFMSVSLVLLFHARSWTDFRVGVFPVCLRWCSKRGCFDYQKESRHFFFISKASKGSLLEEVYLAQQSSRAFVLASIPRTNIK